jgi:hypothetical protein
MVGRYNKPVLYSAGKILPIKTGQPEATPHLATACKGINTIWEMKEIFSEVWEKSAALDSAGTKQ